jgi:thiamine kinase
MSSQLNAFEALAMVPGWDVESADIDELKGGLTNRTYHVRQGDRACVLRLDSEQESVFQFDRSCELSILESAGKSGLAPAVIYSNAEAGILVTEFLPGRAWEEADISVPANLEKLAALLRDVHTLPRSGRRTDMVAVAQTYEAYLEKRHGLHSFATHCVEVIRSVPITDDFTCCHNDIVAANVIQGSGLKLIDWEFASDNDPMFDLASAIGFHNLEKEQSDILLKAYSGGDDGELTEWLAEQVRVFDATQWLWLATRHLVFPRRWQARRLEELQQRIR